MEAISKKGIVNAVFTHELSLFQRLPHRYLIVVYFDQHLGAAHSKLWSKYAFLTFLRTNSLEEEKKGEKSKKFAAQQNLSKKCFVFLICTKTLVKCFVPR